MSDADTYANANANGYGNRYCDGNRDTNGYSYSDIYSHTRSGG